MQRIVSSFRVFAASPAVRVLGELPARVIRRVRTAPEAFVDAIERLAKY